MNGRREKQNTRRPPVVLRLLLAAALLLPAGCGAPADPAPGYRQISQDEAARMMAEEPDCLIVDVRTPEEYAQVRIPGAVAESLQTAASADTASHVFLSDPAGDHLVDIPLRGTILPVDLFA